MEEESPLINRSSRSTGAAGSVEFSPSSQERRSGENVTNNSRDDGSEDGKSWSECFWSFVLFGPYAKDVSLPHTVTPAPKKESKWYDAWNLAANTKEIFIRDRDTDLNALDGVRALAYIWVFNDHLLEMMGDIIDGFTSWELSLSDNTYFSLGSRYKGDQGVTSFFVLSGFLIPFTFTRLIKSKKERYLTWWTAVEYLFRRYARIAPAIYVATIIVIIIGSAYSQDSYMYYLFYTKCARTWYQNYLFVNNYSYMMNVSNCYDSVWTISVEMQLYVLSVIPVMFYTWETVYGYYAIAVWITGFYFLRLGLTFWVDASEDEEDSYAEYIYTTLWGRAAEYGVGTLLYFVYDYYHYGKSAKERRTSNVLVKYSFWLGLVGVLAFGFFALFADEYTWWHSTDSQFQSFLYFLYAVTLASTIYLCIDGTFWPIKWVLSWYVWYPIAQLAYPAGLLNIAICGIGATVVDESLGGYWSGNLGDYMVIQFITLVFSLIAGYLLAITVERPLFNLSKRVKF